MKETTSSELHNSLKPESVRTIANQTALETYRQDGESFDRKRRRQLAVFAISLGFLLISIFAVIDVLEGDMIEIWIEIAIAVILIFGIVGIFVLNADRVVYCIVLNLLGFTLLYNVSIGAGNAASVVGIYIVPLIVFFFLERTEAIISAVLFFCTATIILMYPFLLDTFDYGLKNGLRFNLTLFFITVIAYALESSRFKFSMMLRKSNEELTSHKEKLETALSEIKTLSGMLPICSHCKKIRDDKGYWNQIETYIRDHTGVEFSHSICEDCAKKYYPD
ncbi:MAG: hypothetical protein JRK53_19390 [Deltaproteobacteria bacterium]|nr:hypothetical protein [Deltaproteobacteria bacterium]